MRDTFTLDGDTLRTLLKREPLPAQPDPLGSFTILAFCKRHGMSRSHFYNLRKRGEGPAIAYIGGGMPRITRAAEARWLEECEVRSAATIVGEVQSEEA